MSNKTVGFLQFQVLSLIAPLALCVFSCGKKKNSDTNEIKPAFVSIKVLVAGVRKQEDSGAFLKSYGISFSGCHIFKAKNIVVTSTINNYIENLIEGDTGCIASLDNFVLGTSSGDAGKIFTKVANSTKVEEAVEFSDFVSSDGEQVRAYVESKLSATLGHVEQVLLSLVPVQGDTEIDNDVTFSDIVGTDEVPDVLLSEITLDSNTATTSGIYIFLECEETRQFDKCKGTSLLNMRFKIMQQVSTVSTPEEANALMADSADVIIPEANHLYRNGFRFYVDIPKNADGNSPDSMAVLSQNGTSFRYFTLNLKSALEKLN